MSAVRPLTLSVVPVNGVTTNIPIPNFNHVPVSPIHNFNHVPVSPIIVPALPETSAEEKLASRAEKNREHQRKYVARIKPFQQLANIDNSEERIAALITLSYPEFGSLPKYVLHQDVDMFIKSLRDKHLN